MQYEEALSALRGLEKQGSVYGLERVTALLAALGSPDFHLKIIHVAGTNGKGSTCAFLTSVLLAAGKTVGTFTSPAVFDLRERYLINGAYPSKEALANAFTRALELRKNATLFETEFCAAMWLFAEAGLEYAVVECGCGGRTDATNAIAKKELAVLTSVSYDHMRLLGNTLAEIAQNKAGIVKDCPLVTCRQAEEVEQVLAPYAPVYAIPYDGKISLHGTFQHQNAGLAAQAARILGLPESAVQKGIASAEWHGRFEVKQRKGATFILDGAHNIDAARKLRNSLETSYPNEKFSFVMGMFADKDVDGVLGVLLPLSSSFTAVQAPLPRGMAAEELKNRAKKLQSKACVSTMENAVNKALSVADKTVVCGSLSILAEARRWIDG